VTLVFVCAPYKYRATTTTTTTDDDDDDDAVVHVQELHEPYLVKKMLKAAISSYRDEQEETCDISAR